MLCGLRPHENCESQGSKASEVKLRKISMLGEGFER
jgi:hypothetical protein